MIYSQDEDLLRIMKQVSDAYGPTLETPESYSVDICFNISRGPSERIILRERVPVKTSRKTAHNVKTHLIAAIQDGLWAYMHRYYTWQERFNVSQYIDNPFINATLIEHYATADARRFYILPDRFYSAHRVRPRSVCNMVQRAVDTAFMELEKQ
jgi:hypothetical protein